MQLTSDEETLLIVALGYLVAVGIWLWSLRVRGELMLRSVRERIDPVLWKELGAPDTLKAAVADREHRWMRFVRSGEYRKRCSAEVSDLIDDFRRRTNWTFGVLGVGGLLILYRFWPLLKPGFL